MYDADDLLDAVSTEALRREILTRENKAKQVRIFFSKSNQLLYCLKMAPKIKAMRERLHAMDADRQRFHLKVRPVETRFGGNMGNTNFAVCAEEVIGRDDDKKAIIHHLLDSNVTTKIMTNCHVHFDTCTTLYTCQNVCHEYFDTRLTRVRCARL